MGKIEEFVGTLTGNQNPKDSQITASRALRVGHLWRDKWTALSGLLKWTALSGPARVAVSVCLHLFLRYYSRV